MEMKRCENGHFYDAERTPECPYCGNDLNGSLNITRPLNMEGGSNSSSEGISKTQAIHNEAPSKPGQTNHQKTVAIIQKEKGIDPVVGWLTCIEGSDKGRDYRIKEQRNFIGRSERMDICIRGDNTISRDSHAIISYNRRKNIFRLYQGDSKGIVYINDEEVITAVQLNAFDIIEIGQTKLIFVPLCGERFEWE